MKPGQSWSGVKSGGSWISAFVTSCNGKTILSVIQKLKILIEIYPLNFVVLFEEVDHNGTEDPRLQNPHEYLDEKASHSRSCRSKKASSLQLHQSKKRRKNKKKERKQIQAGRDLWHRQGCRTHRCWARDRRRRPACRISRRPSRSPSIAQLPPTALAIGLRRGAYKFIEVWIAVQCGAVQCSAVRCSKSELLSSCEGGKGKGQGRREGKPIVQILVVCIRERKSRPRVLSPLNIYMIIQLQKSCQLPPQLICDCSSTAWKLPWSASQGSSIDGFPTDSYVQRRCSALGH